MPLGKQSISILLQNANKLDKSGHNEPEDPKISTNRRLFSQTSSNSEPKTEMSVQKTVNSSSSHSITLQINQHINANIPLNIDAATPPLPKATVTTHFVETSLFKADVGSQHALRSGVRASIRKKQVSSDRSRKSSAEEFYRPSNSNPDVSRPSCCNQELPKSESSRQSSGGLNSAKHLIEDSGKIPKENYSKRNSRINSERKSSGRSAFNSAFDSANFGDNSRSNSRNELQHDVRPSSSCSSKNTGISSPSSTRTSNIHINASSINYPQNATNYNSTNHNLTNFNSVNNSSYSRQNSFKPIPPPRSSSPLTPKVYRNMASSPISTTLPIISPSGNVLSSPTVRSKMCARLTQFGNFWTFPT